MTQSASCPNCGSPISEQQQFCGVCGTKLTGFEQISPAICPGCGSSITPEQQFCGVCGANLSSGGVQQPVEVQPQPEPITTPKVTPVVVAGTPIPPESPPPPPGATYPAPVEPITPITDTQRVAGAIPSEKERVPMKTMDIRESARNYGIMNVAAIIFQIFGWIILIGGSLTSIAMAVFAGIGGQFLSSIPGITSLAGMAAVGVAIGGLVASVLYGFGFLAFAEMCRAIIDIARNTRV